MVTHNRSALLTGCLDSLHRQLYRSFELIVVDNGSQNNSALLLKDFLFVDVQIIENKDNYRFFSTNNKALGGYGEVNRSTSSIPLAQLLKCLVKENFAAIVGLPSMIKKCRDTRHLRKLSPSETTQMIKRFQAPLAELVGEVS